MCWISPNGIGELSDVDLEGKYDSKAYNGFGISGWGFNCGIIWGLKKKLKKICKTGFMGFNFGHSDERQYNNQLI